MGWMINYNHTLTREWNTGSEGEFFNHKNDSYGFIKDAARLYKSR